MSYVYIKSEPTLFTVGFYDPKGVWNAESDHTLEDKAADRVRFLNGVVPLTAAERLLLNNVSDAAKEANTCLKSLVFLSDLPDEAKVKLAEVGRTLGAALVALSIFKSASTP